MAKSEFKKQFSMVRFQLRSASCKGYADYKKVSDFLRVEFKAAFTCAMHVPSAVSIPCALALSKRFNRQLSYFDVK